MEPPSEPVEEEAAAEVPEAVEEEPASDVEAAEPAPEPPEAAAPEQPAETPAAPETTPEPSGDVADDAEEPPEAAEQPPEVAEPPPEVVEDEEPEATPAPAEAAAPEPPAETPAARETTQEPPAEEAAEDVEATEAAPEPAEEAEPSPCENGIAVENPERNPGLVADCEALLASRDALAGEGTLNWSDGRPITEWDGVRIAGTPPRVTRLELETSGLTGNIPAELGNLSALEWLHLGSNQLTGPIPAALGSLRFLRVLGLQNNRLSGPIPPELGALSQLLELYLRGNQLTGTIPAALGSLPSLYVLSLGNNQLMGRIPPALGALGIHALDLSDNQLSGPVPPMPGSFDRLEHLALHGNPGLTGCLTVSLAGPRQAVREAGLQECPPAPSPRELCENGTAVPDPAHNPALVADCAGLLTIRDRLAGDATLDWAADRPIINWEGIRIGGDPPRVVTLALPSRGLTGHLPPWLSLSGLQELRLEDNHLSGIISAGLGWLESLTSLSLNGNRLIGPIPAGLGGLLRLESLHLHDNQLSGPIPPDADVPAHPAAPVVERQHPPPRLRPAGAPGGDGERCRRSRSPGLRTATLTSGSLRERHSRARTGREPRPRRRLRRAAHREARLRERRTAQLGSRQADHRVGGPHHRRDAGTGPGSVP